MVLSGNKGEWSEIFVLLKLLSEGKLFSADNDLNKIASSFNPIIKIIREETLNRKIEYLINGNIVVVDSNTNKKIIELPTTIFVEKAKELFQKIKTGAKTFGVSESLGNFIESICITQLKSKSLDKADITLVVHNTTTDLKPTLSFSIKSLVGQDPTLLNPSSGTNFIYEVVNPNNLKIDIDEFNKKTYIKPKITRRIKELERLGFEFKFTNIESSNFQLNLQLLDGDLPKILAELLLLKYKNAKSKITDLLSIIEKENPLKYDLSKGHPFYNYKITSLLYDYALGMTPEVVWKGQYNANGGIIVVKNDSEVVCYHIYDKNLFQSYLINHTKLDQASTGEDEINPGQKRITQGTKKYYYGWLYEECNKLFFKLNLQIRFI